MKAYEIKIKNEGAPDNEARTEIFTEGDMSGLFAEHLMDCQKGQATQMHQDPVSFGLVYVSLFNSKLPLSDKGRISFVSAREV